jgi:hypothetical protein
MKVLAAARDSRRCRRSHRWEPVRTPQACTSPVAMMAQGTQGGSGVSIVDRDSVWVRPKGSVVDQKNR